MEHLPEYMRTPAIQKLLMQGFDAFNAGTAKEAAPMKPGFDLYWWCQGWYAAAIASLRVNGQTEETR
jgi:hypothetical protein